MIFVTVGTHEQQFNRLVEYMDKLAKKLDEEIIIQIGFSTYIPKFSKWKKLFSYKEMSINIEKARIVITHGGPFKLERFLLLYQERKNSKNILIIISLIFVMKLLKDKRILFW